MLTTTFVVVVLALCVLSAEAHRNREKTRYYCEAELEDKSSGSNIKAKGVAKIIVNTLTNNVRYFVGVQEDKLSSAETGAEIRGPVQKPKYDNNGVLITNLLAANGNQVGLPKDNNVNLAPEDIQAILDNLSYITVTTQRNREYEIRGHIKCD